MVYVLRRIKKPISDKRRYRVQKPFKRDMTINILTEFYNARIVYFQHKLFGKGKF